MSSINELFTEKFRPKKLAHLIVPDRIKSELQRGLVQNILLSGQPGTGKTSALFILAEGHTSLYINASEERGIDTIREKISKFCSTISLDEGKENLKCVILDELDGATEEFYKALRAVMERYSNNARFIASCNYIQKIPEPIRKSRFHNISFDPIDETENQFLLVEYSKRTSSILKSAGIAASEEVLLKFIKNNFPDMRNILNKVQSFYLRGVKELTADNIYANYDFGELFDLCLDPNIKPYDNYKTIVNQYGSRVDDALNALGGDFPEYLKNKAPNKIDRLPMVIISVAEYQYQRSFVIDKMITLLAAVFKIQQILK
jgi:replication factor C small subunit